MLSLRPVAVPHRRVSVARGMPGTADPGPLPPTSAFTRAPPARPRWRRVRSMTARAKVQVPSACPERAVRHRRPSCDEVRRVGAWRDGAPESRTCGPPHRCPLRRRAPGAEGERRALEEAEAPAPAGRDVHARHRHARCLRALPWNAASAPVHASQSRHSPASRLRSPRVAPPLASPVRFSCLPSLFGRGFWPVSFSRSREIVSKTIACALASGERFIPAPGGGAGARTRPQDAARCARTQSRRCHADNACSPSNERRRAGVTMTGCTQAYSTGSGAGERVRCGAAPSAGSSGRR